jgi:hypothetical protein
MICPYELENGNCGVNEQDDNSGKKTGTAPGKA